MKYIYADRYVVYSIVYYYCMPLFIYEYQSIALFDYNNKSLLRICRSENQSVPFREYSRCICYRKNSADMQTQPSPSNFDFSLCA